jgi:L-iditol 2-dehydrogenase
MRALHVGVAPHRLALGVVGGRFRSELYYGGRGSPLRLRDITRPERPAGWVRVAPTLAGVCASDRKLLHITAVGRPMHAFNSLPLAGIVPGHEVVGVVTEADTDAPVKVGDRVVPEPVLGCHHKGFPACSRCAAGDNHRCAHQADAGLRERGLGFSFNASFGGGWAEELVVPADRVHRVPEDMDDRTAVLAEPFAVGVHAVLRSTLPADARVLVIGPGTIGLSLLHALGALAPDTERVMAGVSDFADDHARSAGATGLLHGTRKELIEQAGELLRSPVRRHPLSGPVLEDGFDVVYDCVGSEQTMDDAIRMLRPGGELVLVGTSGKQTIDWTLVWHRELTIRGTVFYGEEEVTSRSTLPTGRRRALPIALEVLGRSAPADLVTHVFPLSEPTEALGVAAQGPGAGAIKVAFDPRL